MSKKGLENKPKKTSLWRKGKLVVFFFVVLCSGLLGGFFIGQIFFIKAEKSEPISEQATTDIREISQDEYRFTNPLLDCGDLGSISNQETAEMKNDIDSLIDSQIANEKINSASVYFRDLNNGPWFGINEREKFYAASLLKVPLAMAYFRAAETEPDILKKEVVYEGGGYDFSQHFPSEKKLEAGGKYTIGELIDEMIVYSDNAALNILNQMVNRKDFEGAYLRLGIEEPFDSEYMITVKTYASFFRVLFNSTYLDRTFSEKMLDLLSKTTFRDGIRAAIPSEIAVAHKFGERSHYETEEKQLHDCGIVYYPQKPYLLCIMVRGNDFSENSEFIKAVSSAIYNKIKNK